jgi:hypothetical protein
MDTATTVVDTLDTADTLHTVDTAATTAVMRHTEDAAEAMDMVIMRRRGEARPIRTG